jgi:preprotein translocase subunit SecD
MILYYRLLGVYAVVALTVYGLFFLALFKFIPVTLSLSGIAGFILSLGMAVDANVLIFERFKEELRAKNPVDVATDTSFKRAWTSIREGNISTLITCVILIWFSSSIVKGFAITLSIGVLVSMFSAMVVTKILMKILVSKTFQEKMWLYGVKKE